MTRAVRFDAYHVPGVRRLVTTSSRRPSRVGQLPQPVDPQNARSALRGFTHLIPNPCACSPNAEQVDGQDIDFSLVGVPPKRDEASPQKASRSVTTAGCGTLAGPGHTARVTFSFRSSPTRRS
jgi:hypothetical protein